MDNVEKRIEELELELLGDMSNKEEKKEDSLYEINKILYHNTDGEPITVKKDTLDKIHELVMKKRKEKQTSSDFKIEKREIDFEEFKKRNPRFNKKLDEKKSQIDPAEVREISVNLDKKIIEKVKSYGNEIQAFLILLGSNKISPDDRLLIICHPSFWCYQAVKYTERCILSEKDKKINYSWIGYLCEMDASISDVSDESIVKKLKEKYKEYTSTQNKCDVVVFIDENYKMILIKQGEMNDE